MYDDYLLFYEIQIKYTAMKINGMQYRKDDLSHKAKVDVSTCDPERPTLDFKCQAQMSPRSGSAMPLVVSDDE